MKYADSPGFIRDDPRQILWGWDRVLTDLFSIVVDLPKFLSLSCHISILLNSLHPENRILKLPSDMTLGRLYARFPGAVYCA